MTKLCDVDEYLDGFGFIGWKRTMVEEAKKLIIFYDEIVDFLEEIEWV